MPRRRRPKLGDVVGLTYPTQVLEELSELISADRRLPIENGLQAMRERLAKRWVEDETEPGGQVHKLADEADDSGNLVFAHLVAAWEHHTGKRVPANHAIVCIDGDRSNVAAQNLFCLPRRDLTAWVRFARFPVEVHVDRLEKQIMTLHTSEAVKRKLFAVLEQLTDPQKQPDIARQRAICETVQTLVNLLRVEVAYVEALDGDGVVPFLEGARREAEKRREAARLKGPLLPGPKPDHPWRGLGSRS